jgi:hypothetical protein
MGQARFGRAVAVLAGGMLILDTAQAAGPALDYDVFKNRIEPIFLAKRSHHARCYACHAAANNAFRLEKLAPGAASWSEEQSRRNFATVSALVVPGDPEASRLLLHPLAPEGGGDLFHSGGRQFESTDDPAWQAIARWVRGEK